ncbi:uncharacterized protein LOC119459286 [Dermacentor silvarum]|uniref:uncharacterized protein LOC119459286 n=1 Tax=Dermacentor silvarum TaxID=543639 RepID=UPI0018983F5A|nr:uncharacterized protein LOC119459286 [Dermacentor silvarum]
MQTRLPVRPDPSLDDVVRAAQAMDTAAKDAGENTSQPSLTDFTSVFQLELGTFAATTASIYVPEGARPRVFKPRPLPFTLKDGVSQQLQRLQRKGTLVPVKTSEWAAPTVPALKRDCSVRMCGNFKVTLNPIAAVEKYPLPRIEDLWSALTGGQKFAKLDLRDAYQQLVLQDASRKYFTISTTFGLFQYMRLPFSVVSTAAIFQRKMDNLFSGMRNVAVNLDHILGTGTDDGDHLQNLPNVLARLQDAGLNSSWKSAFAWPSALSIWDTSFLSNLSAHLQHLHLLLLHGQQRAWKKEQDMAFQHSKELITKAPVLVHFGPDKPVVLAVDASPYGVGAVLAHWDKDGQERPLSYRLVYRQGKDLAPADALSHLPLPEVPATIPELAGVFMLEHTYPVVLSRSVVSRTTSRVPVLSQVAKAVSRGEELVQQAYSHKAAELSLQQGCLLWGSRVVIPQCIRSRVLQLLHAGHPGVEKTKIVARSLL